MKKSNRTTSHGRHVMNQTLAAMKQMELYRVTHPGSPVAVRRPRVFSRSGVWVALLGPSVEQGIVGIGANVEAALRAFDEQYLAGLHPPVESNGGRRASSSNGPASSYPVLTRKISERGKGILRLRQHALPPARQSATAAARDRLPPFAFKLDRRMI